MSEAVAATPTTEATPSAAPMSVEDRADALFGTDDPEAPVAAPAEGQPNPAAAAAPVAEDEAAKARAARREAIRTASEKMRERVDAMAAIRERDELRKRVAEQEERAKSAASLIDPTKLDEDGFFRLAERLAVPPQKLAEHLRERYADPDAAAARAAKSAVDPEIAQLKRALEEANAKIDGYVQTHSKAQEEAAEFAAAQQLGNFAKENGATSPLTARFASVANAQEFYQAARLAAERLPEGAGAQAILDEMEEALIRQRDAWKALYADGTTTTQRTQALTTPHQAAAKAPTHVSNTLAQQRSSVVDEAADFARLSVEERAARIFE